MKNGEEEMTFITYTPEELTQVSDSLIGKSPFTWKKKRTPNTVVVGIYDKQTLAGLIQFEGFIPDLYYYIYLIEVMKEYRGGTAAGKLLAYVAKQSLDNACEGFVLLEPKTKLYEFYQKKYGAKPFRGMELLFDTPAAIALVKKYLKEDYNDPKRKK